MNAQQLLLLDRVEFSTIKVEAHVGPEFEFDTTFHQLDFDFSKVSFLTRSELAYPPEEAADPRHFALTYAVKVDAKDHPDDTIPYSLEVEAVAFFRYVGTDEQHEGAERFRAVRFSGYQILHGAIREMVCNLTARARHGILQLPARNFNGVAKLRADEDEQERQAALAKAQQTKAKLPRRKRPAASEAKLIK